jgi:hypothetical protein
MKAIKMKPARVLGALAIEALTQAGCATQVKASPSAAAIAVCGQLVVLESN